MSPDSAAPETRVFPPSHLASLLRRQFHQEGSLLLTRRPGPERASRHLESKQGAHAVSREPRQWARTPTRTLAPSHHPSLPQGLSGYTSAGPASPQPLLVDTKGRASRRRGREGAPGPAGPWTQGSERRQEGSGSAGGWGHHCPTWGRGRSVCPLSRCPVSPPLRRAPAGVVTGPCPL